MPSGLGSESEADRTKQCRMVNQQEISSAPNKMLRMRVPIRAKITIPYLLLSLILAVAAAYTITQLVSANIEERFNKQLFEAGKISSELIIGYETQLLETLRLLANVDGVPSAIRSNNPDALRTLTLGIIANHQREAVEFLDARGNHVLSIHHLPGGNPEDYEVSTGGQTQFSGLDIVKNVLDQRSDERGDKFADFVAADDGNFLYVSGPVYDAQNKLAGVILVAKSLPVMAVDIHNKTFAQISFYDLGGQVIYSTLPYPHNLTPHAVEQTITQKDTHSTVRGLDVSNISFAEILGSWEVRGDNQLGALGVALSKNALVETFTESRWRIFLLVATAILLIILVGINLANTITRPLIQLVQASKKVAGGDLSIMVHPQSNDEVSVLTESFNSMVASLNQTQHQLIQSYDETLEGWAKALELRDKETVGHSKRVTHLTVRLASAMGIQGEALVNIRRGALLHDIGKMGTSDAILHKPGPLDADEMRVIRSHPQDGYNLLKQIDFLGPALEVPLYHHEKWDGTGYPIGLKGEQIPIFSRIFAVIDVFDALTHDRVYRKAMPLDEAIQYLRDQKCLHFDPIIVDTFIQLLDAEE